MLQVPPFVAVRVATLFRSTKKRNMQRSTQRTLGSTMSSKGDEQCVGGDFYFRHQHNSDPLTQNRIPRYLQGLVAHSSCIRLQLGPFS